MSENHNLSGNGTNQSWQTRREEAVAGGVSTLLPAFIQKRATLSCGTSKAIVISILQPGSRY